MQEKDLIQNVKERLGITDEARGISNTDEILPVLKELAALVSNGQYAIGMVLWNADPTPAELVKMAEVLELSPMTLKSWITTYSRLRHDTELAGLRFSVQQQLARVQNAEARDALWYSRSPGEWTLETLTSAVNLHLEEGGATVMPKTKKAGCRARFDGREVKTTVELADGAVLLKLSVSDGVELTDMQFEEESRGVYRIRFDW
jgi:hypothetical protein